DVLALDGDDVRTDREQVASVEVRARDLHRLARLRVDDGDPRAQIRRARLDHDLAGEAGDLVHLLDGRHAFDQIRVLHDAAHLGEDGRRERIPLGGDLTGADARSVLDLEHRAVHEPVMLALAARVVHHHELAVAVHHHDGAVALAHGLRVAQTYGAFGAGLERALLDLAARRRATDVEGPHRELRAGLADRLRRDDADGLTDV